MANLVIVESPAKANTIKGYLGSNYKVIASKGHIRDLPKSSLGIDVENDFAPKYINIRGKGDVIKELKREAKGASKILLATDPDREGEAISWHIANELGIPEDKACRVTFNEITKNAVKAAIKAPRKINTELVNSQQARRILDRLVGFNLSEVLWKNIASGLSGGRVQSVATRIIVDREREIAAFVPQEYWRVSATLENADSDKIYCRFYGDRNGKMRLFSESEADDILKSAESAEFVVKSVRHQEKIKQPSAPFTTSTLQQEASKRLGFQSQKTMKVAQELYDGLNLGHEFGGVQGLITYMRTDSTRISETAQLSAIQYISANVGEEFLPEIPRIYKSKNNSQDAHEAIRPSDVNLAPKLIKKFLTADQFKLYKLIWERFIASQMANALIDTVTFEIEAGGYIYKSGGQRVKFPGFMSLYDNEDEGTSEEDIDLLDLAQIPELNEGMILSKISVEKVQHFTEPLPRYTEASLIKSLEENGIGRPSTYAPIISIILGRGYVERDGKSLVATPLGEITTDFMIKHFPDIVDCEFTAFMENELDSIEHGEKSIKGVVGGFYKDFSAELEKISSSTEKSPIKLPTQESEYSCPKCGKKMIYKSGRFGKFLACGDYPACRSTIAVDKDGVPVQPKEKKAEIADFKCELCGGDVVLRNGRFGEFYACANYPTCKFTKQKLISTGVDCPICGSEIVARYAKPKTLVYSCSSYPECNFTSWDRPLKEKCPDCGGVLYYKKAKSAAVCKNVSCGYIGYTDEVENDE